MVKKMNDTEMSILNGLNEALSFANGENEDVEIHKVVVKDINIRELRERLDLTQEQFAMTFGVSRDTLRNWEQGKRKPEGPARVLLNVIAHDPKCVFDALRA